MKPRHLKQLDARLRSREACEAKRRHRLRVHAEAHALRAMNDPVKAWRSDVPIYVYQCPTCDGWHLTRNPDGNHEPGRG